MIHIATLAPTKHLQILVEEESVTNFKQLVFRATNLWPDAPAEIKEFADTVLHGKILQNYKAQEIPQRN